MHARIRRQNPSSNKVHRIARKQLPAQNYEAHSKEGVVIQEEEIPTSSWSSLDQALRKIWRDTKSGNAREILAEHSFFQQGKRLYEKYLPASWRLLPVLWTVFTWVTLLIHIILIYSLPKGPFGLGVLATADESSTVNSKRRNWGLFFNITATLIFLASNSAILLLLAPTRSDLDRVHAQKESMDIGRASFDNFIHVNFLRKLIFLVLVLSGLGLHAL